MKDFSNKARKAPIAIIDGDEAHRTQMAEALGAFYAVSAFDDGSRAVGTIMADVPEVVIVDENVQPAGGLSVLRRMKDMPALMDVPVICTSRDPNAETGFFAEARGMGFDKGMAKPVKFKRLVTAISESINGAIEKAWDEIEPVQREALRRRYRSSTAFPTSSIPASRCPTARSRKAVGRWSPRSRTISIRRCCAACAATTTIPMSIRFGWRPSCRFSVTPSASRGMT